MASLLAPLLCLAGLFGAPARGQQIVSVSPVPIAIAVAPVAAPIAPFFAYSNLVLNPLLAPEVNLRLTPALPVVLPVPAVRSSALAHAVVDEPAAHASERISQADAGRRPKHPESVGLGRPESTPFGCSGRELGTAAIRPVVRTLRLVIFGPPGSGKTTYGKMIAQDYGVVHVSVGDILRQSVQTDPAAAAAMAKGQLVDTELVLRLVKQRLDRPDVRERGFILDGFPRRMDEAKALERMLAESGQALDAMIYLDVPDAELRRRVQARGRADDSEEVFRDRMTVYHSQTEPVLRRLQETVEVLAPEVSGSDIESNYARLQSLLKSYVEQAKASGRD